MDSTFGVVATAVLAFAIGAAVVLAWRVSERQQTRVPDQPAPLVPPGADSVLSVLRSSAVLVGDDDRVLKASAPAFALGIVSGEQLIPDGLREIVHGVRRDGQVREHELEISLGQTPVYLYARVAPLGPRLILLLVEDRTRERRVESIRRDFVANVSHELKTPVGALTLLAEAVAEAADDPAAVRRFAGRMERESERLSALVQQLIELSRLQADKLVDEPVPVSLDEVVASAVAQSSTSAEAGQVRIVVDGCPDAVALGSPEQLTVAIANLVENAVAYSPAGSRVAVSVRRQDDLVEVKASDQGIGIPPEELDRIFERFYRVDPARHRSTGGTGLGLAIVKHVAASHGGDISVWSEPQEGSTFTLTLPQYVAPVSDDPQDEGIVPTQPRPRVDTGQATRASKESPT